MTYREMAAMTVGIILVAIGVLFEKSGDMVSAYLVPLSLFIMTVALFYASKNK